MLRIAILTVLALSVTGCFRPEEPAADSRDNSTPARSVQSDEHSAGMSKSTASKPRKPLCKPFSEYTVGRDDLNKSVSPCDLYFYADDALGRLPSNEKYFRVVVRRGSPIELNHGAPVSPNDQLRPYHYNWTVLDDKGKPVRSWLAYFLRNRDGNYHTVVTLPREEWNRSVLEVYFEDIDGDGEREDVTFKLMVGEILKREQ
jgi:hypothetical protein